MYRIRRQLLVGIISVTVAGIASAQEVAQPNGTGPASGPSGGVTAAPQPNRVVFTKESLPQMLKQLGYSVTEKSAGNGVYWQIVTQSENWTFTVQVLPMTNQDKITSILLTSDLGRKVSSQTGAQDALKLLQWNQEQAFMIYFGYNAQSRCITAQRPYIFPDMSLEEMRFMFDDFFKTIRATHAVWNPLSGAAAAPAGNGAPAQAVAPPSPPAGAPAPMNQASLSVAGTTWIGNETLPGFGKLTFVFQANGSATMIDAKGQAQGTWSQNGEVTINFQGCVYQGRINGQTLSGSGRFTAGAQSGKTWSFEVSLQKKS